MNAGGEGIQSKAHTAARPAPGWLQGYGEAASQLLTTLSSAPSPGTADYTGAEAAIPFQASSMEAEASRVRKVWIWSQLFVKAV